MVCGGACIQYVLMYIVMQPGGLWLVQTLPLYFGFLARPPKLYVQLSYVKL